MRGESIAQLPVSEFQGRKDSMLFFVPKVEKDSVRSRDVHIEIVKRKLMKSNSEEEQSVLTKKLNKMIRNREFLSEKVREIVTEIFHNYNQVTDVIENRYKLRNFECYDEVRAFFNEECFRLSKNEYALDFMYILVNLCEKKISPEEIMRAMETVCVHPPVYDIL
ncbi:hypothetical protein TNIN_327151 [Trichonephila inaurata madagascariensis]|uniref:Legumain prodomain domain-containing protein n=1 Tax=Trichonephila inaurata madagascariensis TaxID=2747483 RepID=A0A8X7CBH1_9ARAC|nr:hypothetical protein TNIN_327151 [Trichonephila inaurata madagascariensis]